MQTSRTYTRATPPRRLNLLNHQERSLATPPVPDLRGHPAVRLHPLILAVIARHAVTGTLKGARQGYRVAWYELG